MNAIWCVLSFILGMLVMRYIENKQFRDKINTSFKNLLKKKEDD